MTMGRYKSSIGYREPMDRGIFVDSVMHDREYDNAVDKRFTDHLLEQLKKRENKLIEAEII
jgi:hypothetical protein